MLSIGSVDAQGLWLSDQVTDVSTVDRVVLELSDADKLIASTRSTGKERGAKKFAAPIYTELSTQSDGTWESVQGDRMVWRMIVKSPDAYSLNFAFKQFDLPPSAALFIYDTQKSYVIGPITNVDNDVHKEWWSPILPFEEVVIEVQIDKDEQKMLGLNLTQVNHDYVGFGLLLSGSCNIDVICGAEDGLGIIEEFRDIISSVGMYSIGGTDVCSGSLINTTRNDCTPYFLTAFHCEVGASNAASVVVYWNYENSTCRAPGSTESGRNGNGIRSNFNSGSSLISEYDATDFTLLQLDDAVNPDYNPFYAGWDANGEVFDSTLSIHHPNSEEKRISFDYDASEPYADQFFMRVNNWELGTTEGGSSGAPLFNMNKRIIGQLNGGLASCGNADFDDFGMMKISWEGGGTPATRLKDWLDPDNTGQLAIDGRACSNVVSIFPASSNVCSTEQSKDTIEVSITAGYDNGAQLALSNLPEGITGTLSGTQLVAGETLLVFLDYNDLAESFSGIVNLDITDEFGTNSSGLLLNIDVNNPENSTLMTPAQGTSDINFEVNFQWMDNASSYAIEISRLITFSSIEITRDNIRENETRITGLDPATTYYWRVKGFNQCGESAYSEVFSFSTGDIACTLFNSNQETQEILTESNVVRSTISITEDLSIADVNIINVKGTHTWIEDLEFRLITPNGDKIDLLINGCSDQDDFNVSFDDESDNVNLDCPFVGGKAYRPLKALSSLDGMSSMGNWTLEITDDVFLDGGTFESWGLELCLRDEKNGNRSLSVSPETISICERTYDPLPISISLTGAFDEQIVVSLIDKTTGEIIGESETFASSSEVSVLLSDVGSLVDENGSDLVIRIEDSQGEIERTIPVLVQRDELSTSLLTPINDEKDVDRTTVFSWESSEDVTSVHIVVRDPSDSVVIDTILSGAADSMVSPLRLEKFTTYQWSLTSSGMCSPDIQTESFSYTTTMSVSTNDLSEAGIQLYPNPTSGDITLSKESSWMNNASISIYSMAGQLLVKEKLTSQKLNLAIDDISSGIYIYQIIDGKNKYTDKLVVVD